MQSVFFVLAFTIPGISLATTPCQQELNPPAQYGSATHAALGQVTPATTASCDADQVTITTNPIPNQTQLYFSTGYILQNSNWVPLNFEGGTPFKDSSGASHNTWLTGNATASAEITQSTKAIYYHFFSCTYTQNQWKCGCKNQACQTPM